MEDRIILLYFYFLSWAPPGGGGPIHQHAANKEVYSRIYVKLPTLFITYIYNVINHRQSRVLQLGPSYLSAILNNVWLRRRYDVNARKTWLPFEIT